MRAWALLPAAWRQAPWHVFAALWLAVSAVAASAAPSPAWPELALPDHAQTFDVGEQLGFNGVPMRIRGFISDQPPQRVAEWFRRSLGEPLVESTLGAKQILGRPQGEFYLTVQLEAAGRGTRGIVAASHVKAALAHRDETRRFAQQWRDRLPAGSRVLSQTSSEDNGRVSSQLVFANGLPPQLNRDRLEATLRDDGLMLERDTEAGDAARMPIATAGSRLLLFKGPAKEATAVITRLQDGRTAVVLNTVTAMETIR